MVTKDNNCVICAVNIVHYILDSVFLNCFFASLIKVPISGDLIVHDDCRPSD